VDEAPSYPAPAKDAVATDRTDTVADSAGPRAPREGTTLVALLRQSDGATMTEMSEATGWQQHTVRGALAASVRTKLALELLSDMPQGQDRRWRISS
jgi:hypothetical protein